MDSEFWHERWRSKDIGFHEDAPNAYLTAYWSQLDAPANCGVFVPLCGKSKDMLWLARQGHRVFGVELSEIAAREFHDEAGLKPEITNREGFLLFETANVSLYCGDFFSLRSDHLSEIQAVYDRAALVALPRKMRADYAAHLQKILPQSVRGLMVSMEYDGTAVQGPPFSVSAEEIHSLFKGFDAIAKIASHDEEFKDETVRMGIWTYSRS